MNKFLNKYRIPSARWREWNYGDEGAYFVTFCCKNHEHFFGKVVDGEMQLSDVGKIAEQEWLNSPSLRPDMNLDMEIFQIMPNHIHGIIVIGRNEYNCCRDAMPCVSNDDEYNCRDVMPEVSNDVECQINNANIRDAKHCVSDDYDNNRDAKDGVSTEWIDILSDAKHGVSTCGDDEMCKMIEQHPPENHFGPQSKNLASVLRGFKSAVTIEARTIQPDFSWQARFHDHVIRDDDEFRRIAYYIYENPANWIDDLYNNEK